MNYLTGELVCIEYLEIDELEAKCWIKDHCVIGYLDNSSCALTSQHVGTKDMARIISVDQDTERIELVRC